MEQCIVTVNEEVSHKATMKRNEESPREQRDGQVRNTNGEDKGRRTANRSINEIFEKKMNL